MNEEVAESEEREATIKVYTHFGEFFLEMCALRYQHSVANRNRKLDTLRMSAAGLSPSRQAFVVFTLLDPYQNSPVIHRYEKVDGSLNPHPWEHFQRLFEAYHFHIVPGEWTVEDLAMVQDFQREVSRKVPA